MNNPLIAKLSEIISALLRRRRPACRFPSHGHRRQRGSTDLFHRAGGRRGCAKVITREEGDVIPRRLDDLCGS
jgi:hypothetical protein